MQTRIPRRASLCILWMAAATLSLSAPAWAVVPGLAGPLQAMSQILPQLFPLVVAGVAGMLSSRLWRERLASLAGAALAPRARARLLVAALVAGGCLFMARPGNRSQTASAAPPSGGEWPMFRGDLARTGGAPAATGPLASRVLWFFRDPGASAADLSSSPAVAGGRLYVGSAQVSAFDSSGMIYCVDAATGRSLWRFQVEKQVFSSPAVSLGKVYVGEGLHHDRNCKLYCLDAATGEKLWATPTRGHTKSSPAVVGGRVYVGAGEDGVYCLDTESGEVVWHFEDAHVDSSPAVAGGKVFVGTGYGDLRAIALDAATGRPLWSSACDLPVWGSPAVVGGRVTFGIGNGDFEKSNPRPRGGLWCVDAATGATLWRRDLPDAVVSAVLAQGDRVLAGCRDGKVYSLAAATGETAWSAPCGGPVVSSPAADGTRLYAASSRGKLACLDLATGRSEWSLDVGASGRTAPTLYGSPALANGRLYLGTGDGQLLCVGE